MGLKEGNISAKQERFCREYIIDLDAAKAAIRTGYSKRSARVIGARLLTKVGVLARIETLKAARAKEIGLTARMVVEELCKLAFTDLVDVVDITGEVPRIKGPLEVDPVKLGAISEFTEITNGSKITRRIKMHDKKGCLELLGRHLGMFNDKLAVPVTGEVIHRIERVIVDATGPAAIEAKGPEDPPLLS